MSEIIKYLAIFGLSFGGGYIVGLFDGAKATKRIINKHLGELKENDSKKGGV